MMARVDLGAGIDAIRREREAEHQAQRIDALRYQCDLLSRTIARDQAELEAARAELARLGGDGA